MKRLPFDKEQLTGIINKYPTPFHIYDEEGILKNLKRLQAAFSWNPGFKEYFAVKAEPNPIILKLLYEAGCGMDCSSLTELMLCKALGITGADIMFSSNNTPAEEFILARNLNATINLDDITHIDYLKKHGGIPQTISCRFNPGGEFRLGNSIMGNPGDSKYGFTRKQLTEGFLELIKLGVKHFGLHAFLASNILEPDYYSTLAAILFKTAVELSEETGANISFVNLSGGIGIPYRPEEKPVEIERIGEAVEAKYRELVEPAGLELELYSELGRYITGPYGYLVTRAIHKKDTHKHYIGVDACAVNLLRP
ncbi:MAG TPA: diaminopimelate decarboxylase, partial [Clostridia bacterium]|nr:diaminopimelate decarboxylase [Clostridia bacterium]